MNVIEIKNGKRKKKGNANVTKGAPSLLSLILGLLYPECS